VLTFEGLAYGLTPWAVSLESGIVPIYTFFRVVGGMGFAILKSNTSVLLVRVFGTENVAQISGVFLATECLVGLGPTLAFSLHMQQVEAGSRSERSYDVFFYVCAALVLTSSAGVLILRQTMGQGRRSKGKARDMPADEQHRQAGKLAEEGEDVESGTQVVAASAC